MAIRLCAIFLLSVGSVVRNTKNRARYVRKSAPEQLLDLLFPKQAGLLKPSGVFLATLGVILMLSAIAIPAAINADKTYQESFLKTYEENHPTSVTLSELYPRDLDQLNLPENSWLDGEPKWVDGDEPAAIACDESVACSITVGEVKSVNQLMQLKTIRASVNDSESRLLLTGLDNTWGTNIGVNGAFAEDTIAVAPLIRLVPTFEPELTKLLHTYIDVDVDVEIAYPRKTGYGQFVNSSKSYRKSFRCFVATDAEIESAVERRKYESAKRAYGDGTRVGWYVPCGLVVIGGITLSIGIQRRRVNRPLRFWKGTRDDLYQLLGGTIVGNSIAMAFVLYYVF